MTGSQKCLAMPLGLAVVSVSPRAFEAMERRSRRATTFAYDLVRWKRHWVPASRGGSVPEGGRRNQPVSMPTHLVQALREGTSLILEEGMAHRVRRHRIAGKAFRAGLAALKRRPVHRVGHRRLLPRARRHRGLGGGPPDARRLRHPRLDGHRVAPRVGPAGRDDGYDGQSALRPPPPCPRSAWRCGTSGIGRILARPWRPPRPSSTPRHRSPADDFPRRRPAETAD